MLRPDQVEMREQDPRLTKLQELTQENVNMVQACNVEKGLLEDVLSVINRSG
jgi:hypothetical protein